MSQTKSKLPPISKQLLDAVERAFPDVCPEPCAHHDEVRLKMGQVSVTRWLRRQYDIQNTTTLPGT